MAVRNQEWRVLKLLTLGFRGADVSRSGDRPLNHFSRANRHDREIADAADSKLLIYFHIDLAVVLTKTGVRATLLPLILPAFVGAIADAECQELLIEI
jgi:hypothetical protein